MSTAHKDSTNEQTVETETDIQFQIESKEDTIENTNDETLTISSIKAITDKDFENVDLELHGAVLTFNEILKGEDTSQWYFLEKVHENYFPSKDKWTEYLKNISPNKPIDLHDIRKQIINGYWGGYFDSPITLDQTPIFFNYVTFYIFGGPRCPPIN